MTVKQISVFLENRPGKLAEFTDVLSENNVDLRALSLAEAEDFGIARIIVNDVYNASTVLKDAGLCNFLFTKFLQWKCRMSREHFRELCVSLEIRRLTWNICMRLPQERRELHI